MKKKILSILSAVILAMSLAACDEISQSPESSSSTQAPQSSTSVSQSTSSSKSEVKNFVLDAAAYSDLDIGPIHTKDLTLFTGELLEVNYGGDGVFVVKAKINTQATNKLTIKQNYTNVCRLITDNGFDTCREIQYWAMADTTVGEETKVVSFTVDENTIRQVAEKKVLNTMLEDYLTDLWVHQSLVDDPPSTPPAEQSSSASTSVPAPEATSSVSSTSSADVSSSSSSSAPVKNSASSPQNEGSYNFDKYDIPSQQDTEDSWVLNTSTMKIHYPSCNQVKKIAPKNYSTSNLSENELKKQGYTTCGVCHK